MLWSQPAPDEVLFIIWDFKHKCFSVWSRLEHRSENWSVYWYLSIRNIDFTGIWSETELISSSPSSWDSIRRFKWRSLKMLSFNVQLRVALFTDSIHLWHRLQHQCCCLTEKHLILHGPPLEQPVPKEGNLLNKESFALHFWFLGFVAPTNSKKVWIYESCSVVQPSAPELRRPHIYICIDAIFKSWTLHVSADKQTTNL